jgi:hypothetical protein
MIATLGPLCIVAALSGVHAAAPSLLAVRLKDFAGAQCSRCSRSRAAPFSLSAMPAPASTLPSDAAVRQLRERTVQAVLIVMFLVYPSASTEIVKSFRYGVGCDFSIRSARLQSELKGGGSHIIPTLPVKLTSCRYLIVVHANEVRRNRHVLLGLGVMPTFPRCVFSGRCYEFDHGRSYLSVDFRIDCASGRYRAMSVYSAVMMVLIPIGFPAALFWVLWRLRWQLYPMNRDRCLRVRHSPDSSTPCVVACVEAECTSPKDRAELHAKVQRLGAWLMQPTRVRNPAPVAASASATSSTTSVSVSSTGGVPSIGPGAGSSCGHVLRVWESSPGPGDPALQRGGEAMFHYALPPSHTPAAAAAVDAMVRAWHLAPGRYCADADIEARRLDPTIQHLKFAYQVREQEVYTPRGAMGARWCLVYESLSACESAGKPPVGNVWSVLGA